MYTKDDPLIQFWPKYFSFTCSTVGQEGPRFDHRVDQDAFSRGFCMCMNRFPLGILVSSYSPNTRGLDQQDKLPLGVNVSMNGCPKMKWPGRTPPCACLQFPYARQWISAIETDWLPYFAGCLTIRLYFVNIRLQISSCFNLHFDFGRFSTSFKSWLSVLVLIQLQEHSVAPV